MSGPEAAPQARLSAGEFRARLLAALGRVPEGRVVTYGQLALLAGAPGRARQAGFVLSGLAGDRVEPDLPWHRVINAQGRVSTDRLGFGDLQRQLLMAEGVLFDAGGRCDLARHQWWPEDA